jgi:hypothetical protein
MPRRINWVVRPESAKGVASPELDHALSGRATQIVLQSGVAFGRLLAACRGGPARAAIWAEQKNGLIGNRFLPSRIRLAVRRLLPHSVHVA